jgi:hypothetical protein
MIAPTIGELALNALQWGGSLLAVAAVKILWDMNQSMLKSLSRLESHDDRIEKLEAHIELVRSNYVSRIEMLETLKRIELLMENVKLREAQNRG